MKINPKFELLCECIFLIILLVIGFMETLDNLDILFIVVTAISIIISAYRLYSKKE